MIGPAKIRPHKVAQIALLESRLKHSNLQSSTLHLDGCWPDRSRFGSTRSSLLLRGFSARLVVDWRDLSSLAARHRNRGSKQSVSKTTATMTVAIAIRLQKPSFSFSRPYARSVPHMYVI